MTERRKSILFNDAHANLGPLTDLRPPHAIRTGAMTTAERLTRAFDLEPIGIVVPNDLKELTQDQSGVPVNEPPAESDDPVLMINGRCPLPIEAIGNLKLGEVLIEASTKDMIAVCLTSSDVRVLLSGGNPEMKTIELDDKALMRSPWDWRAFRDRCIEYDLQSIAETMSKVEHAPEAVMILGEQGVVIHPDADIMPGVILNAELGPIIIEENATVRPGSIITGPAYIGPGTTVLEQANIKPNTAIGPVCKVAGEIGGTIFQGYANKAHAGHLGDSWIGEWSNLGADTTNSNLLNTYAEVTARATSDSKIEKTGQTFLGVTMGDHTKTAIGTRIMTGAIVGTGTMFAASTPMSGTIDAFSWITDSGTKSFRLGKFVDISMSVMGRRGIKQSQAYSRRLTILHEQVTGVNSGMNWPGKPMEHLVNQDS
jgi:UDP-N-acetylglucosamine diphosphorylase/glucosamine-1-phosphate N-acetyltransferase